MPDTSRLSVGGGMATTVPLALPAGTQRTQPTASVLKPCVPTSMPPPGDPPGPNTRLTGNSRPKATDYDAATRRILDTAIEFYHADLLRLIPFPQPHTELKWAKDAWSMSCDFYGTTIKHDPNILKLAGDFLYLI